MLYYHSVHILRFVVAIGWRDNFKSSYGRQAAKVWGKFLWDLTPQDTK